MKTYILRRAKLGRGSVNGIVEFSNEGIEGYLNDGRKHENGGYIRQEPPVDADLVIRWGCTSNLIGEPTVVNKAKAIHYASDKATSRKEFADAGLAPRTWLSFEEFRAQAFGDIYPVIVRPSTHAQGKNLDVCNTHAEVFTACEKYGDFYISEFIDKVQEFRVFALQGRVVWVAEKTPADPKAVAWNVAQGGKFDNVRWGQWNLKMISVALEAYRMSGLDFGGIDVMVDKGGKSYVLEINSAPSQTSPYRQECCARAFDYLIRNYGEKGLSHYPIINNAKNWRDFIHPGLLDERGDD